MSQFKRGQASKTNTWIDNDSLFSSCFRFYFVLFPFFILLCTILLPSRECKLIYNIMLSLVCKTAVDMKQVKLFFQVEMLSLQKVHLSMPIEEHEKLTSQPKPGSCVNSPWPLLVHISVKWTYLKSTISSVSLYFWFGISVNFLADSTLSKTANIEPC